jgi:hypothetical protein
MTLCVTVNTIILSLDYYGISEEEERLLNIANLFFTIIFALEMVLKILSEGVRRYLADKMNHIDGSVAVLSLIEVGFNNGRSSFSAFRTVRIFRTFRVLRVARLLRSMQSMQVIIGVVSRSISQFIYLAMLLLLFIFIYALLGM